MKNPPQIMSRIVLEDLSRLKEFYFAKEMTLFSQDLLQPEFLMASVAIG